MRNKMMTLAVAVVFFLVAPSQVLAQEEAPAPTFTLGCEAGWYSKYVIQPGLKVTESGEGSVQTSCKLAHQSGFFVSLWRASSDNYPVKRETFANENNFLVGFDAQSKINEKVTLNVNATFLYIDLANPKTERFGDGDMIDISWTMALEHANWKVRPYVSVDVLFGLGENGFDDGWYGHLGASSEVLVGIPIGLDANLMRVEEVGGMFGTYAKFTIAPRFALGDFTLTVPLRYWHKFSGIQSLQSEFIFGAAVSF